MPVRKPARLKRSNALLDGLFAKAILFPGEPADDYAELQKSYLDAIPPKNALQRSFVLELVAKSWEILRLQGYRKHIIDNSYADAITDMMTPTYGAMGALIDVKAGWLAQDPQTLREVKRHRKRNRVSNEQLAALAYAAALDKLERIDQRIAELERSRGRALRNIAVLDALLSRRLAEAAKTIEGEFRRRDTRVLLPHVGDEA